MRHRAARPDRCRRRLPELHRQCFGLALETVNGRSALGVGRGTGGTATPSLSLGLEGLVVDNQDADIGVRHYIGQGSVLFVLTALSLATTVVPRENGRLVFAIRASDSLLLHTAWSDFDGELSYRLGAGSRARSMHSCRSYDGDSNTLAVVTFGVSLLEPGPTRVSWISPPDTQDRLGPAWYQAGPYLR